jgi:hypothetical protein
LNAVPKKCPASSGTNPANGCQEPGYDWGAVTDAFLGMFVYQENDGDYGRWTTVPWGIGADVDLA